MTLSELQAAILRLPVDDRARLQAWLTEIRNKELGDETTATRLGRMAGKAFADIRKRVKEP
jgi:hypothetical protein